MSKPPNKETLLYMAEHHFKITKNEKMMWNYLLCWAFYEMYIETWGLD